MSQVMETSLSYGQLQVVCGVFFLVSSITPLRSKEPVDGSATTFLHLHLSPVPCPVSTMFFPVHSVMFPCHFFSGPTAL